MVAQGKSMGLIPDPFQIMQEGRIGRQAQRIFSIREVNPVLTALGQEGFFGQGQRIGSLVFRQPANEVSSKY